MKALPSLVLFALLVSPVLADNGLLEIHFINVGQGDCTFVSCPDGENVLIDCGTSGGGDGALARQYLQKVLGTTTVDIDTLVVTHPDKDHYNLLPDRHRQRQRRPGVQDRKQRQLQDQASPQVALRS